MAVHRTDAEIRAIVDECLRIERAHGDVLAYLRSENYISPKGTWFNFQRGILGRKTYQITSGRPRRKTEERKMGNKPRKDWKAYSRTFCDLVAGEGLTKQDALQEMGVQDSRAQGQYFRKIKEWLLENDPVAYDLMMDIVEPGGKKPAAEEPQKNAMLEDHLNACARREMIECTVFPEPAPEEDELKCKIMELETKTAKYRYEDHHIGILVWSDEDPEEFLIEEDKIPALIAELPKVIRKFREGR